LYWSCSLWSCIGLGLGPNNLEIGPESSHMNSDHMMLKQCAHMVLKQSPYMVFMGIFLFNDAVITRCLAPAAVDTFNTGNKCQYNSTNTDRIQIETFNIIYKYN